MLLRLRALTSYPGRERHLSQSPSPRHPVPTPSKSILPAPVTACHCSLPVAVGLKPRGMLSGTESGAWAAPVPPASSQSHQSSPTARAQRDHSARALPAVSVFGVLPLLPGALFATAAPSPQVGSSGSLAIGAAQCGTGLCPWSTPLCPGGMFLLPRWRDGHSAHKWHVHFFWVRGWYLRSGPVPGTGPGGGLGMCWMNG